MTRDLSLLDAMTLVAAEHEALTAYLRFHQDTLLTKIEGLDDVQLSAVVVPSGLSLIGLVKHLTYVHASWLEVCFDDQLPSDLRLDADEWAIEGDETTTGLIDSYRLHVDAAREILSRSDLDELSKGSSGGETRPGQFNLRWIVIHMIEELARHNGHADIVRELIDGRVGV